MTNQDLTTRINDARKLAQELQKLLYEDALHRLRLYQKYSSDNDTSKWTPNLYIRCQLVEELCSKLNSLNL